MPAPPSTFTDSPVTAKALNASLYVTYTSTGGAVPNGVNFHCNRPVLLESLQTGIHQQSTSTGTVTSITGTGNLKNFIDTSALFSAGADGQWDTGSGRFSAKVPASDGDGGFGGIYLSWGFANFGATPNAGGSGAALNEVGSSVIGCQQLSSATRANSSYVLDLVQLTSATDTISLQGYCADTSGSATTYNFTTTDYSGNTTRFCCAWAATAPGSDGTVASVPSPPSWTAQSAVTTALLNGDALADPLTLLNNPPLLRAGSTLSTSIPANTNTLVPVSSAQLDNYNGFNASSSKYTVPLDGIYLVHGLVHYSGSTTGNSYAGIRTNGSFVVWGPAYSAAGSGSTSCSVVKLLDLHAGDTIELLTVTNGLTNSLGNGANCRLVLLWMSTIAASNGSVSWQPPDASYRWQAGTSGDNLVSAFQQHLTSDLSFLIQRPYLTAYQSTAQTGLSQNVDHVINMDTQQGLVHASPGDNYGGWNAGSHSYVAAVSGWYLVVAGYKQSPLASGTASCAATIVQSPSGSAAPDYYQRVSTTSVSFFPGAEAVGLYYLRAGDSVQPQYEQIDGGATFSTVVNSGHQSTFGVIWLCE